MSRDLAGVREEVASLAQAPATSGELTKDKLADGLPLRYRKDLASAITPLSSSSFQPTKKDLQFWWKSIEAAILGLGGQCNPLLLENTHIQRLTPVILGDLAWVIMQGKTFTDWQDFRNTVDARYGLTKHQCLAAFYDMRPSANKSMASFLRRVEDMRVIYREDEE